MDTYAPPMSRAEELDDTIAREADANPDADFDVDGLAPVTAPVLEAGADVLDKRLQRWKIFGMIAGGVALTAAVAGVAYLSLKPRAPKPQTLLEKMGMPKVDLSKAHPRRLSHIAGRRIEQLPVRQVQKRVADRVSDLFG
jgi:hypothetical protein